MNIVDMYLNTWKKSQGRHSWLLAGHTFLSLQLLLVLSNKAIMTSSCRWPKHLYCRNSFTQQKTKIILSRETFVYHNVNLTVSK